MVVEPKYLQPLVTTDRNPEEQAKLGNRKAAYFARQLAGNFEYGCYSRYGHSNIPARNRGEFPTRFQRILY